MAKADVHLDGRTLEGGGQLLRLALSLSCLTGRSIRVTHIRGNRPGRNKKKPGGGMKGSHFECAKWLAQAANAETEGMAVGSSELIFRPRLHLAADIDRILEKESIAESSLGSIDDTENRDSDTLSASLLRSTIQRSVKPRRLTITQKTPGAIHLIVQALLPYILFGPFSKPREGETEVPLVQLRVIGGTNVSASMSSEYARQVLFPTLQEHLGFPHIRSSLIRRGWSSAPGGSGAAGGNSLGEELFEIAPLSAASPLKSFAFETDGRERRLQSLSVSILAHPPALLQQCETALFDNLDQLFPDVPIQTILREDSGRRNRVYMLVVAHLGLTSSLEENTTHADSNEVPQEDDHDHDHDHDNGHSTISSPGAAKATDAGTKTYRLGRDFLLDGRDKMPPDFAHVVSKRLARELRETVRSGTLVDEHLQDQLVVFQALAQGCSRVATGRMAPTLHTQTARWVAEQILARGRNGEEDGEGNGDGDGLKFAGDGSCAGISFVPGGPVLDTSDHL